VWHLVDTGPFSQVVTNGRELFTMPRDRSAVLQYQDSPPSWITIGGPASWLYAGENALYGVTPDQKNLARYLGTPQSWQAIGGNAAALAGLGLYLFGITPDLRGVWVFNGTGWSPYAGPANALCTGGRYLYLVTPDATVQYVPDLAAQKEAEREPEDTVTAGKPWQWVFPVSDAVGAAYDGEVNLTIFWSSRRQQSPTLPVTSFKRATSYPFDLQIDDDSTRVESISLGGTENFFDDQIRLDTVTATDPNRWLRYEWPVNQKLPNGETINIKSIVTEIPQPKKPLTIYVWDYLGKNVAWGHVSCRLDDGTYISWWPSGIDRVPKLQSVPNVYSAPARDPQTYDDDVRFEYGAVPTAFQVTGLDHKAILAWWQTFKATHRWETFTQNCATTVAQALWAGDAAKLLSAAAWVRWSVPGVWTPDQLLAFGADINAGQGPKLADPGDADAISPGELDPSR
jgi:hypothetical protein